MTDIIDLTVARAIQALNSGDVSSRELTSKLLERTELLEPKVKAYLTRTPELALEHGLLLFGNVHTASFELLVGRVNAEP